MEVIRAENLTIEYYHSRFSLKNINLSINEGEIVLLTGNSGCGKSTLLYCLSGIIPHLINVKIYNGAVYINGLKVKGTPFPTLMRNCGVVLQNPTSQIFGMTVEEDLFFGLENLCVDREEIKERVDEIIEFVNLEKYRDADPLSLSGGEKQRVAIGSMLVMKPKIIFLDEPTSNLDPRGTREILLTINKLKDAKKTVILVDRKIEHIVPFVDRIIALDKGSVILDKEPKNFFVDQNIVERLGVSPPQIIRLVYGLGEKLMKKGIPLSVQELRDTILEVKG